MSSSDVDLLADFDPSKRLTLLNMAGLENRLAELLGTKIDLSPSLRMHAPVFENAAREAVDAF